MHSPWLDQIRFGGSHFQDSYALGTIVVQCIFVACTGYIWNKLVAPRPSFGTRIVREGAYKRMKSAIGWLFLFYILVVVDLFIIETNTEVTRVYTLFSIPRSLFLLASELYFMLVAHRVISSLLASPYASKAFWICFLVGELYVVLLGIQGLYFVGSQAATFIVSVDHAAPNILQSLSRTSLSLESAYYSLSLVFTFGIFVAANFAQYGNIGNPDHLPKTAFRASGAALYLLARTLSEFIIVTRYSTLKYEAPSYLPLARSLVYGITTVTLIVCLINSGTSEMEDGAAALLLEGQHKVRHVIATEVRNALAQGRLPRPFEEVIAKMEMRPEQTVPEKAVDILQGGGDEVANAYMQLHRAYIMGLRDYLPTKPS